LRDLIEANESEKSGEHIEQIEASMHKFKKEMETFFTNNNISIKHFKQEIEGMASISQMNQKFNIIDNEIKNYKWRTEDEMSKKVNFEMINKIMLHMHNIISKLESNNPLSTKQLLTKDKSYRNYSNNDSPVQVVKHLADLTYEEREKLELPSISKYGNGYSKTLGKYKFIADASETFENDFILNLENSKN